MLLAVPDAEEALALMADERTEKIARRPLSP
jgi:hypothetical protein